MVANVIDTNAGSKFFEVIRSLLVTTKTKLVKTTIPNSQWSVDLPVGSRMQWFWKANKQMV
jgi:hypothetical protein